MQKQQPEASDKLVFRFCLLFFFFTFTVLVPFRKENKEG